MKRLLTTVIALGLIAALAAGITALLYTEAGMQWAFARVQRLVPGQLTVERLDGRLAGPLALAGLRYENDALILRADRVTLRWQPGRLVDGVLVIEALAFSGLDLTTKPASARSGGDFDLSLPLAVELRRFDAAPITWSRPGEQPVTLDALSFSAAARDGTVTLSALHVAAPRFTLDGTGELPLNTRDALRLELRGQAVVRDMTVAGTGTLEGTWRRIAAELRLTQPFGLDVTAHINTGIDAGARDGNSTPRWQLRAAAEPFAPTSLLPQAPPGRVADLVVQADGHGVDFTADGGLTWRDERYGDWAIILSAARDGAHWELPQFQIKSLQGSTDISGHAQAQIVSGAVRDYLVEARWRDLAWPPDGAGSTRSPQGALRIAGDDLAHYDFTLAGTLQPPQTPPLSLTLSGQGDRDGMRVDALAAEWLDGAWSGQGSLAWSPALRWDLALTGQQVNPAALNKAFDGRLDAAARIRGDYTDAALTLSVDVDRLTGTLHDYPVSAHTRIALQQGELRVEDLQLRSGDATLAGNARFGAQWQLDWRLDAPALAKLHPDLTGSLTSQGSISGPRDALRTRLELDGSGLSYRDLHAGALRLRADIDQAPAGRWELDARAEDAGPRDLRGRLTLDGSGTSQDHILHLSVERDEYRFAQALRGALHDRRWQARLHDGRLELAGLGLFTQRDTADLTLSSDTFRLQDWCWRQDTALLCLAGAGNPATADLQTDIVLRRLDLARLSTLIATSGLELGGTADGEAHLTLAAGIPQRLNLSLRLDTGTVGYPVPATTAQRHILRYRQADVEVTGNGDSGLSADIRVDFHDDARLAAAVQLPQWDPAAPGDIAQQALAGHIELDLNDLSPISLFLPDLQPGAGRLQARATLSGTVADPRLDGELDAELATLAVARLGLELQDVNLHVQAQQNRWQLQGDLRSGAGRLALDGNGFLLNSREWEGKFALRGKDADILRLPTATVTASPDLTLHVTPGDLAFAGTLAIPSAQLEPTTAESTIGVSEDVVIVGGEGREATPRLRVHGSLDLVLGDKVRIAGRGLEGRLTGHLRILMNAADDISGQGEIHFVEGRYRAYGQNLSIDQGRVLYAGGPIDNPALDIVASRQRGEDIKVGVRVTGTAKQPLVQLFSDPAMDDGDILSYIILGRPLEQASDTEGEALYQAATSIALVGGEAVAGRIAGVFNISEVSIEAGETSTDTALVLGKSLSPRLYVRYLQGLAENASAFQIRYRLSDKWTLETESGTRAGSGVDLIYTLER